MTAPQLERIRRLLCALQDNIRDTLVTARRKDSGHFARIAGVTSADTIYHVDRLSEAAILAWFQRHWPRTWPVEVVMEGIADGEVVTFPRGTPVGRTRFKCILDPIDGTRSLMYDKRAAWSLAALAPQRGARTQLGDIMVAAMTELPTSKQGSADQFSAIRGRGKRGVVAHAVDLRRGTRRRFTVQPTRANHFAHGFASLVKFFPAGKALTARIEEDLWRELHGRGPENAQLVFDDQYLSTGGQLAELLVGHDRMIGDLRPLVFAKLRLPSALTCHPYDICTALILTEAGGIVEAPSGRPLRAPLDTTTPVTWMGYANPRLARTVRPVLRRLLKRHLG
jgi:fructose-1,6-bisphosphatase/inositol monophosphatase family enzyme